jgi:hypothetical protein
MWTTAFVSCRIVDSESSIPFLASILVPLFRNARFSSLAVVDSIASDCGDRPEDDDAESVTSFWFPFPV